MTYSSLHPWNVSVQEAIEIQKSLKKKIILKKGSLEINKIAGADVSFSLKRRRMVAAVAVCDFVRLTVIRKVWAYSRMRFPYIPGLLTFREGPALLAAFRKIKEEPDLIIFDGQGIAHPRRMGIATHMGILLNRPSIGCAKTPLYGDFAIPQTKRGSFRLIKERETGEVLGACLRTRKNVRPVFVSAGYKIDLQTAIEVILYCSPKYRIPEPIRLAHSIANEEN